MFSRKSVCKLDISKIVRPVLAALSVNGLNQSSRSERMCTWWDDNSMDFLHHMVKQRSSIHDERDALCTMNNAL